MNENKAANILSYAMEMELEGNRFFLEKSKMFVNPTTKALFENLAKVELDHYNYVKNERERYLKDKEHFTVDENILKRDENDIFYSRSQTENIDTTLLESDVPDLTVLRMAYLIERDYAQFYRDAIEQVEEENLKKLFETLAKWEDGHEKMFKKEYDRLKKEYLNMPWGG